MSEGLVPMGPHGAQAEASVQTAEDDTDMRPLGLGWVV
jgi:hypothetical protein